MSLGMAVAACLLSAVPHSEVRKDRVGVLELNHFHDENGKYIFSQFIGWDVIPANERQQPDPWPLLGDLLPPIFGQTEPRPAVVPDAIRQSQYRVSWWVLWPAVGKARPYRDFRSGDWVLVASHAGTLRTVRATSFIESWTQYDPELNDRSRHPAHNRVGLAK